MSLYGEVIQEHFRRPRRYGALEAPDIRHEDANPLCGDRVRIELLLGPDGHVLDARFQGDLCMIAKAASSILLEMIAGRTLAGIGGFSEELLLEALQTDMRPSRRKCALLPLEVLRSGVEAYVRSQKR